MKALQAIEAANVAILLLDASTGITEQDAHVAGYVLERGRAVVLAVNKWDAADKAARERMKMELAWKLGFLGFAETHFVSAKEGKGLGALMRSVDAAHAAAMARLSTPKLTRAMIAAVERQAPPKAGWSAPSCATRTRAASTRRASSSTATRSTACRSPTSATWKVSSNIPPTGRPRFPRAQPHPQNPKGGMVRSPPTKLTMTTRSAVLAAARLIEKEGIAG